MLADAMSDRGLMVEISGDTKTGRRRMMMRASSEMGVHRPDDVDTGGVETAYDCHTQLQVSVLSFSHLQRHQR